MVSYVALKYTIGTSIMTLLLRVTHLQKPNVISSETLITIRVEKLMTTEQDAERWKCYWHYYY